MSVWETAPLVVGHRGGRGDGWPPENTIEAFDQARSEGVIAVELDVRTSADGDAVVFHDTTLARMTRSGDLRPVHRVARDELCTMDLGGGARIPSLVQALAWAHAHSVAVNVELKHDVPSRWALVRAAVRALRMGGADVLLSSFDPILLAMAAVVARSVPRALLTEAGRDGGRSRPWVGALGPAVRRPFVDAVHVEARQATPRAVAACAARGLRMGVWTVNDPAEAAALVEKGVSTVITDRPGAIAQVIGR